MRNARWLIVVALLVPGIAGAGVVRGTLDVSRARARIAAASAHQPDSISAPPEPLTEAVVCVEAIPAKLEHRLARRASPCMVVQQGGAFFPRTLCVPESTSVTFLNRDRVYHNVFSVSPARRFDTGQYGPRESRSVTLAGTGAVQLFCEIHPGESGFIFVVPNHAFTRTNSAGRFVLPNLPAGKYVLRAWHPTFGATTKEIVMPARGDAVVTIQL